MIIPHRLFFVTQNRCFKTIVSKYHLNISVVRYYWIITRVFFYPRAMYLNSNAKYFKIIGHVKSVLLTIL
jgi:hypothetical protein